jgi:uncharacterized protein (TIGR02145 family)
LISVEIGGGAGFDTIDWSAGIFTGTKIIDLDGNIYGTVKIGTQVWMAENLRTTRYNDGSPIPEVTDNYQWGRTADGAYCWYNNDSAAYDIPYGKLYNFFAVYNIVNRVPFEKLCPSGWHVPREAEWSVLINYLGGPNSAGSKLKETGTAHWASPNRDATNETGFTALPGGCRNPNFRDINRDGYYWGSTKDKGGRGAFGIILHNTSGTIEQHYFDSETGFSVRCIKD